MSPTLTLYDPSGFDPRLRDGGDGRCRSRWRSRVVSIHASVMEATGLHQWRAAATGVSIHASVMEATGKLLLANGRGVVSIHASVMEATVLRRAVHRVARVSIHASVMEATRHAVALGHAPQFRSTPP